MATPTPGSASKRLGGGVNHSSPAPRSVPSPNTTRQPAGKTPVNHPTTGSSQGSKTLGSTPMVQSLSQSGNFASPSANNLIGTPNSFNALGINVVTPGPGTDGLTPSFGNLMARGASAMPVNEIVKRNEDEERRVKMRKVLKRIGRPCGKVTEDGITRLVRRVGLVTDLDDETLTAEQKERVVGNRSFSVAGQRFLVTVTLKDQTPQSVEVGGDVSETDRAAQILLADLKASDVALTATLDQFAQNLSRWAQVDHLETETGTNCFVALDGIYRSLRRLHGHEKKALQEQSTGDLLSPDNASLQVMCKKSGRPSMHARGRLGLHLDYWQHPVAVSTRAPQESYDMDVDATDDYPSALRSTVEAGRDVHTLWIGADDRNIVSGTSDAPQITPLRVSDQWLPEPLDLPTHPGQDLPWTEPLPNISTARDEKVNGDPPPRPQPSLRFVATIDPPVIIPFQVAMAAGMPTPVLSHPASYTDLLLPSSHAVDPQQAVPRPNIHARQSVLSIKHGEERTQEFRYTLSNAQLTLAVCYQNLPFASPKDLVTILPLLRQWAAVGALLKPAFRDGILRDSATTAQDSDRGNAISKSMTANATMSLSGLLQDTPPSHSHDAITVAITLSTEPTPILNVAFPLGAHGSRTANVVIHILQNADVAVEIHDGLEVDDKSRVEQKLARALSVCWDLGVWIEWVRVNYG